MINKGCTIDARRDAATEMLDHAQQCIKSGAHRAIYEFGRKCFWPYLTAEYIRALGDYEMQSLVISFAIAVKHCALRCHLRLDIPKNFPLLQERENRRPTPQCIRRVLMAIQLPEERSIKLSNLKHNGRIYSHELYLDFNVHSISANLYPDAKSSKDCILLDIYRSSISNWSCHGQTYELTVGASASIICLQVAEASDCARLSRVLSSVVQTCRESAQFSDSVFKITDDQHVPDAANQTCTPQKARAPDLFPLRQPHISQCVNVIDIARVPDPSEASPDEATATLSNAHRLDSLVKPQYVAPSSTTDIVQDEPDASVFESPATSDKSARGIDAFFERQMSRACDAIAESHRQCIERVDRRIERLSRKLHRIRSKRMSSIGNALTVVTLSALPDVPEDALRNVHSRAPGLSSSLFHVPRMPAGIFANAITNALNKYA